MIKISDRDRELILRIIEHAARIESARKRFGDNYSYFCNDADYRDAVNMNIFQMGELANQISEEAKEGLKDIPWHKMYGIRNIMAHAYLRVDAKTVWDTIINDIPNLSDRLEDII